MQRKLETMRFLLVGFAKVVILAGVRPVDLVVQGQFGVGMSVSLKVDDISNHQTLSHRNDILNKAIAQASLSASNPEINGRQRNGKRVLWLST